ncbi:2'-deoxymugineic-acid 2'-dioxygenase [Acorus calamus]|uniref:2'-deoxymugineic-acid 2'-dioxygenase n=1 Tax=Acorus calamus TaxID=4465 RepID=A0AAV9C2V3_ACOCL|nr:2'-deoxymugineic-acid 2'-dioxygenase [Acorus calamus]
MNNKKNFLSSFVSHPTVPESYIYPPEKQPGKSIIPTGESIPVIDLGGRRGDHGGQQFTLVEQIMKATQEFGFFQVINHGISVELLRDTLAVASEFFEMSIEDRIQYYSDDPKRAVRVYMSCGMHDRGILNWREAMKITGHPVEKLAHLLPEKPNKFRSVVVGYSAGVTKLAMRILGLINEGLGLEEGYFDDDKLSGGEHFMLINHYPPCPDPSLTLGLVKHCDPNLITVLLQGKTRGLQVIKDGKWISVEPIPDALVVNVGHQLEIISNGRLKSVEHRAVTNLIEARTTVVTFINPAADCLISPAPVLVGRLEAPLYRAFTYKEFFNVFRDTDGDPESVLEAFKI